MLNQAAFVDWTPFDGDDFRPHPTKVCEPINLACTNLPALVYDLKSEHSKGLSTLQVETIRRIFQSFASRGGFLLGDATGVGKGRTIAGVLHECKVRNANFRAVWISANGRLRADAEHEIASVGAKVDMKDNVLFCSYTAILKLKHYNHLLTFLKASDERLLILDECHALRNESTSAKVVESFVNSVDSLNVLYSSATAASSLKHLQYLTKLQLWGPNTPFPDFASLASLMKTHGTPLMELLAIQMRSTGSYVSRQLSFSDVIMEHVKVNLSAADVHTYDTCAKLLCSHHIIGGSSHQSFFQKLITGLKTRHAIAIAKERLAVGDAVVFSLVNTGEAVAKRALKRVSQYSYHRVGDDLFEELGEDVEGMPINPIDQIVEAFGADNIAELTGRTTTFRRTSGGFFEPYTKGKLQEEAKKFQLGEKNIAILSRAGGVGISLHDNMAGRRRSHIILEMPWSAEDFMQQLGRTHRSNSKTAPYYVLLSTNIPSEMRFASSIVQKLASMGALIRGDRSCCDVNTFNVPKWAASTRRSLGLYLATSRLCSAINLAHVTDISRTEALRTCGYNPHANVSNIVVQGSLTRMVVEASSTDDRDLHVRLLNAVKCLYPQEVIGLISRWSPDTHMFYPLPFKDRIKTLLLCHNSWEARNTLGLLPEVLLYEIFEHVATSSSVHDAKAAANAFIEHDLRLTDLSKYQTDQILNRLLGMEISVQKTVMSFTSFFAYPKETPPVSCFFNYVKERAGHSLRCEVTEVRHASFSEGAKGVQIMVAHTPADIDAPPIGTKVWRHERSGRVMWIRHNTMVSTDGMTTHIDDPSDVHVRNRGFALTEYDDWVSNHKRARLHAQRRAKKLPKQYFIATENAMKCWEGSLHRILRVPPCIQFPKGMVGLLVFVSR